ncbi:hypothetical protein SCLCIDRAFT_30499 [Scleroderma citrinum Foug A]|uniref:Uncharacterized protein n=1 Tax=Scleroderma citrinum Foug A TaxID=1036808 RepID=A0A0C3D395_9AGAM|nr:hypothetical protein SCLCIDRAFT_30499 [Scleroderma citrinum Foug A]
MPLDSTPPLPPVGKPSPPPKHQCSSTSPCAILLSEVGKRFHAFPKGTFRARFAPPAVPNAVLKYVDTHPLTWSWTTKAGPRAGKTFTVPTVPTACSKGSPKAVHWIVSIFHAFKTQLAPAALNPETGRVLPDYVKLYQNNMLVHLRSQQARIRARPHPPTKSKAPASTPPPSAPSAELVSLKAEIAALRAEFEEFKQSYENSSLEASSSPPRSPRTAPTVVPPQPPSPSTTASSLSMTQECTSHPQHRWLQPVLDHPSCPALFHHIDSSMVPIYVFAMPDDVQRVLMVYTNARGPRYLGFDSNGDLYVSGHAPADLVITSINAPDDIGTTYPPPVPCELYAGP